MAHERKNYTVLIGYPAGGGHWTEAGQKVDLLDVEALALEQAGRIKLTSQLEAEQAAAAAAAEVAAAAAAAQPAKKATKTTATKDAE